MQSISDSLKEAGTKFGGGNDRFQFQEGTNKLRVLAMSADPLAKHFMGKGKPGVTCVGIKEGCTLHGDNAPLDDKGKPTKVSIKYLVYALDRKDNKIKLIYMPYSVCKAIGELQMEEDWTFDDMPMPYDINVKYDPKAAPMQMYVVTPSPARNPLTPEVQSELAGLKSLDTILESIKKKQSAPAEDAYGYHSEPAEADAGEVVEE